MKKKLQSYTKRWISVLLVFAMSISLFSALKLDLKPKAKESIGQEVVDGAIAVAEEAENKKTKYFSFGSYPFWDDNTNGYVSTPLVWRVLSEDENYYTLLMDRIMFARHFGVQGTLSWEDSSVREFLNGDFYSDAFEDSLKKDIEDTRVSFKGFDQSLTDPLLEDWHGWNERQESISKEDYAMEGSTTDKVYILSAEDYMNPDYGFSDSPDNDNSRLFYFDPIAFTDFPRLYPTFNEADREEGNNYKYYIDDSNFGAVWVWTRDVEEIDKLFSDTCPTAVDPRGGIHSGPAEHYTTIEEDGSYLGHEDYGLGRSSLDSAGIQPVIRVKKDSKYLKETETPKKPVYPGFNEDSNDDTDNNGTDATYIDVLATKTTASLLVGQKETFACSSVENGSIYLTNLAIVSSDPTVISIDRHDHDVVMDGHPYHTFDVTALKKGTSYLTISDNSSGTSATVTVTVDDLSSPRMYPISNPFKTQKEINGVVLDNYSCSYNESTNEYIVHLDAYNYNYYAGAVDVFDKDGKWIGSEEIERKGIISDSFKFNQQVFFYLPFDIITGDINTYKGKTVTKHTSLDFKVPQGGCFSISNNFFDSNGTAIWNGFDLFFDLLTKTKDFVGSLGSSKAEKPKKYLKESFKKKVGKKLKELPAKSFQKESLKILEKVLTHEVSNKEAIAITQNVISIFKDLLLKQEFDLNSETKEAFEKWVQEDVLDVLVKFIYGIGETVLKVAEPGFEDISKVFEISGLADLATQIGQVALSSDNPVYTFYTDNYKNSKNNSGVYVEGIDTNTPEVKVQAFRIYSYNRNRVFAPDTGFDELIDNSVLYNISLVKDDQTVQPSGKVKVHIPIPNGLVGTTCFVYRQESNGTWTALSARVEGKYLVFETDHFSLYAITGDKETLKIKSLPDKINYNIYEPLDTTGLELLLGDQLITEDYLCTPATLNFEGDREITVYYGLAETTFKVHVTKNGFVHDPDGIIRYYNNGKVETGISEVKYDPVSMNWYNVVKGVVTAGPTVAHNAAGWWYIDEDGKVDFNYFGFANNAAGQWYCKGGFVDFKTTEVVYDPVSMNWYFVKGNRLTKGPDIQPNAAGWWYVDNTGKVDFKKNGVEHNAAGWWYVKGGKVDFSYTGIQPNAAGWWRIEGGKVNFNFTGIASNAAGFWYLKGGKVDFSKNGKVKYNGKTYTVKGGKVVYS